MSRFAKDTEVPVMRSQMEIGDVLRKYGADSFGFFQDGDRALVTFRAHARQVRMILPLPHIDSPEIRDLKAGTGIARRKDGPAAEYREKLMRQKWRCLLLSIRAKLEAVETGIESFENAFMAHICLPNGQTTGEWLKPQLEQVYLGGKMPPLLEDRR